MGLASLPFQILLYFQGWITGTFFLLELGSMIYKGIFLPYPSGIYGMEIVFVFLYVFVEFFRLFFGYKGNLTAHLVSVLLFIILSAPLILANIYFMLWEIYVLNFDLVLNGIILTITGVEVLLAGVRVHSCVVL